MTVSKLITTAFTLASQKYPELHKSWSQISYRIGGRVPHSRLTMSVQRDGQFDLVLRAMEDDSPSDPETDGAPPFGPHYLNMLSELWVGSVYETVRLLIERGLGLNSAEFQALAHDLRLLRITLEKHEIAGDRKLSGPLEMRKHPPNDDSSDIYEYKKDDPTRAHIMPSGMSHRGSVKWQVLDLNTGEERWIERRELSDRFLSIWESANQSAASAYL